MANYTVYFDGSCGPKNPGGTAAFGFVLMGQGQEDPIDSGSGVIGSGPGMTNNVAEFHALINGLLAFKRARGSGDWDDVQVFGDSKLVIEVMSGRWKPKFDKVYFSTYVVADELVKELRKQKTRITFDWIPREMNTLCDNLSKAHNIA